MKRRLLDREDCKALAARACQRDFQAGKLHRMDITVARAGSGKSYHWCFTRISSKRTRDNCWDYILDVVQPEEHQLMVREAHQRARLRCNVYPLPEMCGNYRDLALDFKAWVEMDEELAADTHFQRTLKWLRGQA